MEQGKSRVFPLFQIKNQGAKTYTIIALKYRTPEGLSASGKKVCLKRKLTSWALLTLKPGKEITLNPSYEDGTYLSASSDQAKVIYSTNYWFEFSDEDGHRYETPEFEIENFIIVAGGGGHEVITNYAQPLRATHAINNLSENSIEIIKNRLGLEISKLRDIVASKHLTGLIELKKFVDKSSSNKIRTEENNGQQNKRDGVTVSRSPQQSLSSPKDNSNNVVDRAVKKARQDGIIPKNNSMKEAVKWLLEPAIEPFKKDNK